MKNIKKSIIINAPVNKVYDYLVDQMNKTEWMSNIIEAFKSPETNVGDKYKCKYGRIGILFQGVTTIIELTPHKRIRTRSKGCIRRDFSFNLETHNGGTLLDINIDYVVTVPVVRILAEKLVLKRNERKADLAVRNIKYCMEK